MSKLEYESPSAWSKDEALKTFEGYDVGKIQKALLGVVRTIDDYDWVLDQCLRFTNSHDKWVARNAVTCLGHIARIYGKIDRDKVLPALEKAGRNEDLIGNVEDALSDIDMFARPS